uniref:Proline--tRNA ligase n=1 Tax=Chromera velia CCMP2878 TaxID=1169474 RepID=A0A0G4HE34_9ALVE|eukprot:Cvel_26651.t1-p1 / transcript=Cvel_26651.t1 / gene=Cvel_26651 / organism=Chromera_velia_CCMP2878 / gene_product=Proline--tRNA ligase, putative / transcript_product=Proline--tRNA ligase, putative / location=Cvel_scaffold3206:398-3532(+) / protein_length=503 / sequence_SO=supercontig / SO=protein_coding / is_pseudo=false
MKDAYSFHLSDECLEEMYTDIWNAYHRIFSRLGLNFRAVEADSGAIGGAVSHEFQVLAEAGEDAIAVADMEGGASENEKGNPEYAANIERAEALPAAWPPGSSSFVHTAEGGKEPLQELVSTPGAKTIPSLCEALGVAPWECLKTLAVAAEPIIEEEKSKKGKKGKEKSSLVEEKVTPPAVLLVLRGDHSLNEVKAEKLPGVASPLRLLSEEELESAGLCPGFLGPVALSHAAKARGVRVVVDRSAAAISGPFVSGGNSPEMHLRGCQWDDKGDGYTEGVDARVRVRGEEGEGFEVTDLREVVEGDKSPDGVGTLRLRRGIEVGHIFQLGKKYTEAMGVSVQDEKGRPACPLMGCYGIGIGRVVAAAIEQEGGHDEKGIRWPLALAPFHVSVVPVNLHKSELVKEATEKLCEGLVAEGLDVLLDDRKERPGTMFADSDLWGIPVRVVVGEKNLKAGLLECKLRSGDTEPQLVAIETMPQRVAELLRGLESKPKIRQRPNKKNV